MASDTPGVCRHRRRWWARVSVAGRWVKLKLCPTEWEAARLSRLAREGRYDRLPERARVKIAAALGVTVEDLLELAVA